MKIRLLHLEDNIADAELIQIELQKYYNEYEVKHVRSRNEYVAALKEGDFDVILSDYNVPGIVGLESMELALSMEYNIPFIYVSGAVGEESAVDMLKSGATDFVLKSKLEKLHISINRSVQAFRYRKLVSEKEQLIKDQQLEYRYLIDRINEGFVKVDTEGLVTIVNPAACQLFLAKLEELIGKDIKTLLNLPVSDIDFQISDISNFLEFDRVLTRTNGDRFWANIRISNQLNELGESAGYAIIIRDITNQKLSEVWEGIISKVARKISSSESSISTFFQKLYEELMQHIPCNNFFAVLRENSEKSRMVFYKNEEIKHFTPKFRMNCTGLSEYIINTKKPLWQKNKELQTLNAQYQLNLETDSLQCVIGVPIITENACIGVIGCIDENEESTFNEFHFKVLTYVGRNIGILIRKLESEINRNRILQLSEDLICTMNKSGELIYVNPAFHNILGYEEKELLYKPLLNIFDKSDKASCASLHYTLEAGVGTQKFRSSIVTKPGEVRFISWTVMCPKNDQSYYGIGRDITEQRAIQKQIEESEKRYRGLFERMNEGLLSATPEGIIVNVNPSICDMLGYSAEELLGKNGYDLLLDRDTASRLKQKLKYRKKGQSGLYETILLRKNGDKLWVNVSATPNFDNDGNFSGVMLIILNITDRKAAERAAFEIKEAFTKELELKVTERTKELEKARKELAVSLKKEKELGRLKSRFVSMASHQFRTPLSVIQSNIGVLDMHMQASQSFQKDKAFQEKFEKINDRVKVQITRMTDLMNDVLILGKINEGNITLRLIREPLVPVCQEILESYSYSNQRKSLRLEVLGDPVDVLFDKQLFTHALSNLVSNAIKYSNEDKVPKVTLNFKEKNIEIKVKDEGIGIPEDELPHLFEPFYRASNVKEYSGTGLGTAIAKEYIELIGGTISVHSELGVGTEFTITLNN
ncbi:MAG: PAS domain S-box protein [Fluviicola sp.]